MIVGIKKIIFLSALAFIAIALFSLTIGQQLPYEFANNETHSAYYETILIGLPTAILLTLIGTIKKENSPTKNWLWVGLAIFASIVCFGGTMFMLLSVSSGGWIHIRTLHKHKTENTIIIEQFRDKGPIGGNVGSRIVEIKPFLKFWVLPTQVDTQEINKNEWDQVNESEDIPFP